MSQQLLEMVAKATLKDVAKKNTNSKDPYFEYVKVLDKHGRATGKVRKQKKGLPSILSAQDGRVLKKVRRRAYHLDMGLFNCCGFRVGWSALVALIPFAGDVVDLLLAWSVVRSCQKVEGGLPAAIQARMYFNIALDFGIGLVPFLGDIADAIFRANTRNAWVLEEYLIKKAQAQSRLNNTGGGNLDDPPMPAKPKPSMSNPFSARSGLFGFGGKTRQSDEEMAGTST